MLEQQKQKKKDIYWAIPLFGGFVMSAFFPPLAGALLVIGLVVFVVTLD